MQNTPSAIDLAGSSDESLRDLVADEITGDGSLSPEVAAAILAAFPEAADAESGSGGCWQGCFFDLSRCMASGVSAREPC